MSRLSCVSIEEPLTLVHEKVCTAQTDFFTAVRLDTMSAGQGEDHKLAS